jgi:hypothetical protein
MHKTTGEPLGTVIEFDIGDLTKMCLPIADRD